MEGEEGVGMGMERRGGGGGGGRRNESIQVLDVLLSRFLFAAISERSQETLYAISTPPPPSFATPTPILLFPTPTHGKSLEILLGYDSSSSINLRNPPRNRRYPNRIFYESAPQRIDGRKMSRI